MFINHNHLKHNNLIFACFLLAMICSFSSCSDDDSTSGKTIVSSPYDSLKPIGFGEKTTGGNNQNVSVATTAEQLAAAMSGINPATVYLNFLRNILRFRNCYSRLIAKCRKERAHVVTLLLRQCLLTAQR